MPRPQRSRTRLLDIEGIETVQVSIGSSGSALRDAFSGGGSGITYSITTDPDVDQVALREEVQAAVADLDDVGTITVAGGGGGFGSSDIEIDVTAPDSATLQEATDAVVAAVDRRRRHRPGHEQPLGIPPLHRRGRSTATRPRRSACRRSRSARSCRTRCSRSSIGTVEIDDTTLTVYLAASQAPATIDELRELSVPVRRARSRSRRSRRSKRARARPRSRPRAVSAPRRSPSRRPPTT